MNHQPADEIEANLPENLLSNSFPETQPPDAQEAMAAKSESFSGPTASLMDFVFLPVRYSVSYHFFVSRIVNIDNNRCGFPTYTIKFRHVQDAFGDKYQHWNQNHGLARMIFQMGPVSSAIKGMINTQHKVLYRETNIRKATGVLNCGEDFLRLINFGMRDEKIRLFSYAIIDKHMAFSETGDTFFQDFMSKHATHSSAAKFVRYSGEFHIQPIKFPTPGKSKYKLIIDNKSGTYGPDKDDLPLLKRYFALNLPDLEIECYDYNDPVLSEYKKSIEKAE
eukprot:TRINITY_DN2533_c0_g1_i1.p1 TRINITY_DN2533_c0_g1~~TRINITY_DN2533_c0_g1_i1.p1  ORF type:complete len:279 (+),score=79.06 TRINITY_DN2533_c0_g1_i1:26-862(+)